VAKTAAGLLPEIQPTLYMAVPRIWNHLQNVAVQVISNSSHKDETRGGDRARLPAA